MAAMARAISAAVLCLAVACGKRESESARSRWRRRRPRRSTAGSTRRRTARRSRRPRRCSTAATRSRATNAGRTLSKALLELHNAIVFRDSSPSARETSRRLFFFSAQVDAATPGPHVDEQLVAMREAWERIRAEQFASADFFHTGAN